MINNNKTKGYILGAIAAANYGMNPLFALPLYSKGMGVDSVLFYRYTLAIIMLAIMMKIQKQSFAITIKELIYLVIMGLMFSFSSIFLFISYQCMDAGIASTILFVYPILVAIIMVLFFKEKISLTTSLSIALAFTGIALLCNNTEDAHFSWLGVLFVFLSSLSYAIYIVGVNKSILKNMPITKLTFYALLFGVSIYIFRLNFLTDLQIIPTPFLYVNVLSLALFPTVISLIAMTKAIHYIGSIPTTILGAMEPITALFFGVVVFGEKITPKIMFGVILVIIAVTLIIIGKPLTDNIKTTLIKIKR